MSYLTKNQIAQACEKTELFLKKKKKKKKENIRLTINLEEVLIRYQKTLGSETPFFLQLAKQMGKVRIRLSIPGPMVDPFANNHNSNQEAEDEETENDNDYLKKALLRMGELPVWHYRKGQNIILITLTKTKLPEWIYLILAMICGVLCGLLVKKFQWEAGLTFCNEFVHPLMDTYLKFLNAIASPLIFLLVLCSIYNIGDASTFHTLGKKLIRKFILYLCLITGLTALSSLGLFSLNQAETHGGNFSALYKLLLDIIPANLIAPFFNGNTLQILFLAVITGLVMVSISEKVSSVAAFMEQFSLIISSIMGILGKLVSVFIFGSLFYTVATSGTLLLGNTGKFFFGTLFACILILILYTAFTCIHMKWTPARLWKSAFSTFFIGLTTASSSASLTDDLKTCKEKYKISPKLVNFAVPIGQIIFKPCNSVMYFFAAVCVADETGISVSLSWFVTLFIISIILSASSPPVAGGSTAGFTIMFVQLGLSLESLPVILALNAVLMYIRTATNLFTQQCILLGTAKSLKMIENSPDSPLK